MLSDYTSAHKIEKAVLKDYSLQTYISDLYNCCRESLRKAFCEGIVQNVHLKCFTHMNSANLPSWTAVNQGPKHLKEEKGRVIHYIIFLYFVL